MNSKKIIVLSIFLIVLLSSAQSRVTQSVEIIDQDIHRQTNITLESKNPVNHWQTSWELPEDTEDLEIRDTKGEIEEYNIDGRTLTFNTTSGDRRKEETVTIEYKEKEQVEEVTEGLEKIELQLSGLKDQKTTVFLETPHEILGIDNNHGTEAFFEDENAEFVGDGPVNIIATWTDRDDEYENYILFGEDVDLSTADEMYPVVGRITGQRPMFRKLAVIVKEDREFDEKFGKGRAGVYQQGGIIYIRSSETEKELFPALMMHETTHAYNQEPLNWVRTDSAMFDEGTATYVEHLVRQEMDVRQPELFGEEKIWEMPCEDSDGTCTYTLPPMGQPEHLWNYYQDEKDFMKEWDPTIRGQVDDKLAKSTFGYSYSQLLIREYMNGTDQKTLEELYDRMEDLETAETSEEYMENLETVFDGETRPCYYEEKKELESCLEELNDMNLETPENFTEPVEYEEEFTEPVLGEEEELNETEGSNETEENRTEENITEETETPEIVIDPSDDIERDEDLMENIQNFFKTLIESVQRWIE